MKKVLPIIIVFALVGAGIVSTVYFTKSEQKNSKNSDDKSVTSQPTLSTSTDTKLVEFSNFDDTYKFSGYISNDWEVEYVSANDSLNIYNPNVAGETSLDKSQIFIRNFSANSFLTLNTVDILSREETTLGNHAAVRYEIVKQPEAANFPSQPAWRNEQHKLIDVRYADTNPSTFFVIAANPALNETVFDEFLKSLRFHNDLQSYTEPLPQAKSRVTKKPFGIFITPETSPVQPDKFDGYHTGVDFEIIGNESEQQVSVKAICSGPLKRKGTASGYGGYAVQQCQINDQIIQVIYGHIALASVNASMNDSLLSGQYIARLGEPGIETDDARKHLHLSVRRGTTINILGYVTAKEDLEDWIDPLLLIP